MDSALQCVSISRCGAGDVIDLRHAVLRKGLARETAVFAGDEDSSSRHFAAIANGVIVGCATLHLNAWENKPAWQLRGMAVVEAFQGRGIGAKLLQAVDRSVAESPAESSRVLWCNARVPAKEFYERHGWTVASGVFEIPTAGPHVKMIKTVMSEE